MTKRKSFLFNLLSKITFKWSLFITFSLLILVVVAFVFIYSIKHSKLHSKNNAERACLVAQEKTEKEIESLFESINNELIRSHALMSNGLIDLDDLSSTVALFTPGFESLNSCLSMNIADLHGNNVTIFRNLDTANNKGTINSKWTARYYKPDFNSKAIQNKALWYRFNTILKDTVEAWQEHLFWSAKDLDLFYPGQPIDSLTEIDKIYDPRKRAWHKGAVDAYKNNSNLNAPIRDLMFYTDIDIFFTTKALGVTASIASNSPDGEVFVVAYDLLLEQLSRFTMDLKPSENGFVWVFDEEARIIALPNNKKFSDITDLNKYYFQKYDKLEIPSLNFVMNLWFDKNTDTSEFKRLNFDNQKFWFSSVPYTLNKGKTLWIGILIPEKDINSSSIEETNFIIGLTLVLLIFSFLLAFYFSKIISKPIVQLKNATIEYIDGYTEIAFPKIGTRELVDLSNSISIMQADIHNQMVMLKQNEKNYKSLVSNLPGIVYRAKCEKFFDLVFVSDKVYDIVKHTPESFVRAKDLRWIDFIHPEEKQLYLSKYSEMLNSNLPFEMEYRIVCDDGSIKWMHESSKVIKSNECFVEGFIYDVTDRKNFLEQIRKFSRVVDQNPAGIIVIRVGENIEYVNPKILELTGYSYEDFIGHKPDFLKNMTDSGYLFDEVRDMVRSGMEWEGEIKLTNLKGDDIWVTSNIFPLRSDKEEITHVIIIVEDITEKVEVKKQLIDAKEQAEESNKLKSHFLSNMSHEIRTPMNGIIGFLGLLKNMNLTEEKRIQYIDIINKSGKRLLDTVNDIIEMSKIESGEINVVKSIFSVNELLDYLYNFFIPQTTEKNLRLELRLLEADISNLFTDKHLLEGVLINLIKNAIKFTSSGFVEFGCENEGKFLKFYVKDSGKGIPAEKLNAVFERFVQADIKHTRGHEGSGLGLAISRSYIEILGGEICATSEVGVGSNFYFTVPMVLKSKDTIKQEFIVEEAASDIIKQSEFKVLVAEDDETSYRYIETMLKNFNAQTIWAKNGEESVQFIKDNTDISLVLLDLKMPLMDGYQACENIKRLRSNLPVIVQTAFAFPEEKTNAFKAGCDDYLVKPISNEELYKILRKYV